MQNLCREGRGNEYVMPRVDFQNLGRYMQMTQEGYLPKESLKYVICLHYIPFKINIPINSQETSLQTTRYIFIARKRG